MYIITALLVVIAATELIRLTSLLKPDSKRSFFKNKLKGVQHMIWDLQFKKFKTLEIREDIRKEYDSMQSRIATIDNQIGNFPDDGNKDELKRLSEAKDLAMRDIERFKAQIDQLDAEVNGQSANEYNPEGTIGIVHNIDSLRELEQMLKDWIKTI